MFFLSFAAKIIRLKPEEGKMKMNRLTLGCWQNKHPMEAVYYGDVHSIQVGEFRWLTFYEIKKDKKIEEWMFQMGTLRFWGKCEEYSRNSQFVNCFPRLSMIFFAWNFSGVERNCLCLSHRCSKRPLFNL